jgi:hypothetical protein
MPFWRDIKATAFSTWGYRKFVSGQYEKAASLFEKAILLTTDTDVKRISHTYLGRSYVSLVIDTFDLSQVQEAVHVVLTTRRSGKVLLTG